MAAGQARGNGVRGQRDDALGHTARDAAPVSRPKSPDAGRDRATAR
jgi:hypothetical protein